MEAAIPTLACFIFLRFPLPFLVKGFRQPTTLLIEVRRFVLPRCCDIERRGDGFNPLPVTTGLSISPFPEVTPYSFPILPRVSPLLVHFFQDEVVIIVKG